MERKFNKGDLVELPSGVRMFFTSYSDAVEGNVWLSCKDSADCVDFMVGLDGLKLITPAKQYITVNGHKVPKPLSYEEAYNIDTFNPDGFIYTPYFAHEQLSDHVDLTDTALKTLCDNGMAFKTPEDAEEMAKALLSAIPKQ